MVLGENETGMAVISLSNLKKTWYYMKKNGPSAALAAVLERLEAAKGAPYVYEEPEEEERRRQRRSASGGPSFSVVVPAYATKPEHLRALLSSVKEQTAPNWELLLSDATTDASVYETARSWAAENGVPFRAAEEGREFLPGCIRYLKLEKNLGIAGNTNEGIGMARGEYTGLLDHDDLLTPDALYEMGRAAMRENATGMRPQALYSDEDKCDGAAARFYEPHRKTDFNPDLLLTNNYICHFLVMETGLLKRLLLRPGYDGAQDYDLVLRAMAEGIHFLHVPKVLYHWRCHEESTAANPRSKAYAYEAGRRAVEDYCRRAGWKAGVSHLKHLGFYRVDYEGDIFAQRPEVGAVAWPLPGGRRFLSGIYLADGGMLYGGLRRGFSGPMHRASLQQDVGVADVRCMKAAPGLEALRQEALGRISDAKGETAEGAAFAQSAAFCEEIRKRGQLILWDPMGPPG